MGLMDGGGFTGGGFTGGGRAGKNPARISSPKPVGGGRFLGLGGVGSFGPVAPYRPAFSPPGTTYAGNYPNNNRPVPQITPGNRGNTIGGGPGSAPSGFTYAAGPYASYQPYLQQTGLSISPTGRIATPLGDPVTSRGTPTSIAVAASPANLTGAGGRAAQIQNAANFYQGFSGPERTMLDNQARQLAAQLWLTNANYAQQGDLLRRGNTLDQQMLGTQRQGIGIDQAAINRQQGYYGTIGNLNEQGIDIRRADAFAQHDQQKRAAESDATARGAMFAPGIGRTRADLAGQLYRTVQGLGLDSERNKLETAEQQARLTDRRKQLDIESGRLGIQSQQLGLQLEQGLARLGLDQIMSVGGLLDGLNSNDMQRQQLSRDVYNQIISNFGFFPTTAPTRPSGVAARPDSLTGVR